MDIRSILMLGSVPVSLLSMYFSSQSIGGTDDNSITIAIGLLFVGVGMIISSFFVGKK